MVPLNIPNALTMLRILAVPVVVVALLAEIPNGDLIAGIVFALAALTDGLDGYIARRRDDVTTFGKLMDPLADKLLIVAALVSLVSLDRLQAWIAMVIIARELAVTGLRARRRRAGRRDLGELARQGEDGAADRGRDRPDRRRPGDDRGRHPRLRGGGRDRDLGRRLLLRRPAADREAAARPRRITRRGASAA